MNFEAIDRGVHSIVNIDIPEEWKEAKDIEISKAKKVPGFIKNISLKKMVVTDQP